MVNDLVEIKTNTNFVTGKGQSPIVKCLLYDEDDIDLFRKYLSSGYCQNVENEVENIIKWRNMLEDKFGNRKEQYELCVLTLGHLISAKYSGKAQSFDAIEYTLDKLSNAMSRLKPITFTFCFGGYKSHTSPAHPEVDWAELFNLNYLVSYLYPIIMGYKYGVELEYESEEVSIQFNNVPQELTNKYTTSFYKLIEYYKNKLYQKYNINLPIKLTIARDLYKNGVEELYKLIEQKKEDYRRIFEDLSESEKNKWISRAKSNYMWNGIIKHDECSDKEKYDIYKEARITNEAFLDADYILREDWFEDPYRIPLTGTWGTMPSAQPIDGWLHIKSTANSKVDCWIGTGALEEVYINGKLQYRQSILSKKQLDAVKFRIQYIDVKDKKLEEISSNFHKIPIVKRKNEYEAI